MADNLEISKENTMKSSLASSRPQFFFFFFRLFHSLCTIMFSALDSPVFSQKETKVSFFQWNCGLYNFLPNSFTLGTNSTWNNNFQSYYKKTYYASKQSAGIIKFINSASKNNASIIFITKFFVFLTFHSNLPLEIWFLPIKEQPNIIFEKFRY